MTDLSAVFCSDPEKGQAIYDKLPKKLKLHFARCFAHAAELCEHPGVYDGPVPEIPDEEE